MINPRFALTLSLAACLVLGRLAAPALADPAWSGYGGNAQHTANSTVRSQSLQGIAWQAPVDLNPQYTAGGDLLAHYGSPSISAGNTVLIPVKTGATDGFRLDARSGADGSLLWQFQSDYSLPSHNWTPSYSPTLTPSGRVFLPGAGGTLFYRDSVDSGAAIAPTRVAFYGDANYAANAAAFNAGIQVCTPLTSDAQGNVYFGFRTAGSNPGGVSSGIARIGADGTASYVTASAATAGGASEVVMNCAPAVSADGKVYIAMRDAGSHGYLVSLDSQTLATNAQIRLKDPKSGADAILTDDGTASPTIAPDGNVFMGVLESPFNSSKGWMLQFNAGLTQTKTPGAFGWDISSTIVPASLVPSYHGTSAYLIMTKYNNYAGLGGDGVNKLAILDPNDTQVDARTGQTVMKEVLTIAGVTADAEYIAAHPNAVREWCINTAVLDAATDSILANSEDGKLYRWSLATNSFSEVITLTSGIGEAYTPTVIGADGKVYAINNATLFAVGAPEPGALWLFVVAGTALFARRRRGASTE